MIPFIFWYVLSLSKCKKILNGNLGLKGPMINQILYLCKFAKMLSQDQRCVVEGGYENRYL